MPKMTDSRKLNKIGTSVLNFIDKEAEIKRNHLYKITRPETGPRPVTNKDVCPPQISQY